MKNSWHFDSIWFHSASRCQILRWKNRGWKVIQRKPQKFATVKRTVWGWNEESNPSAVNQPLYRTAQTTNRNPQQASGYWSANRQAPPPQPVFLSLTPSPVVDVLLSPKVIWRTMWKRSLLRTLRRYVFFEYFTNELSTGLFSWRDIHLFIHC